jgi:uncharacterized protein (DUF58 family)
LLAAALVVLPVATVAGMVPGLAVPCAGILAVCFAASVVDAMARPAARGRVRRVRPRDGAAHQRCPGGRDHHAGEPLGAAAFAVRAGLAMPDGVASERIAESVTLQPGRSLLAWPCTGTTRGDHALRDLHVETPSPLGLWLARARVPVACNVRVYPNLRDRATAALFLRAPNAGMRVHRQVGKGREFERCASTYRAIATKISTGRPRRTAAVRW